MSNSPFSELELERYARHIIMREIGGAGQQKLKKARVLVVGAGGLGSPILQYLAAAGVGTLGLVDDDHVSLSNLQRQIIHDTAAIGQPKVESALRSIARQNPHISVEAHCLRLSHDNASALIENYDIVVDGCDNAETRYMLAEVCEVLERPLVSGAIGRFDGTVTVLMPYVKDETGRLNPRYRDLFPVPPPAGSVPACAEAGVLGVLPGIIGSLQAMEVIKLIAGIGEPLVGRLLLYDALACRFETIRYKRKL
ncbi:molybdopterin-synthase adenylyltransferase MoeB [Paenochrobactrum glaciei]|uniref:Molybdopterin-synthase adenylyltransferase MoeB n=1 Tax=Paenochrobactrum glaciei TaxID=486407 RepID=A0ABP3QXX2_9HYPH